MYLFTLSFVSLAHNSSALQGASPTTTDMHKILHIFLSLLCGYCLGFDNLLEGDVAAPKDSMGIQVSNSFTLNSDHLWPNGVIPYLFENLRLDGGGEEPILSDDHKQMVREAIADITKKVPCLQFRFGINEFTIYIVCLNAGKLGVDTKGLT
jgi:hypothetical protein